MKIKSIVYIIALLAIILLLWPRRDQHCASFKDLLKLIEDNKIVLLKQELATYSAINAQDQHGDILLTHAVAANNKDAVKELLEKGTDPNIRESIEGYTALHYAAEKDNSKDIVQLLLEHNADATIKDENGNTPLDIAIKWNRPEIAHLLTDTKNFGNSDQN